MAEKKLETNFGSLYKGVYAGDRPDSMPKEVPKEPKIKLNTVVKPEKIVTTKKKWTHKLRDLFIPARADEMGLKEYLLKDVLVPTVKDSVINIIENLFYNTGLRGVGRSRRMGYGSKYSYSPLDSISYNAFYKNESIRRDMPPSRYEGHGRVDYRNIVLMDREDAETIVSVLQNQIRVNGKATIEELYETIDADTVNTDALGGGTRPEDIRVRTTGQGYLIDVREARPV